MFVQIRKHQQWLFIVIIAGVIVSFVIFFTPGVGRGSFGRGSSGSDIVGSYDGRPIPRSAFRDAYEEVLIRYLFSTGRWPDQTDQRNRFDPEQEAGSQYLLIQKLDALHIQISKDAVAQWIVHAFTDPTSKEFSQENYDFFVKQRLAERRLTEEDFMRYVRHQIGISQLSAVAGLSGQLVTPRGAERLYREENLQAATSLAIFSRTNYPAAKSLIGLGTFYTNRMALYRIPERRRIHFVRFANTNYLAEAEQRLSELTNLTERIEQIYVQRGTDTFTNDAGNVLDASAAKEKIRQEESRKIAKGIAKENAMAFARELYAMEPIDGENLPRLAAAKGVMSETTAAFGRNQLPPGLSVPYQVTQQTFNLTEKEPFMTPVQTSDAIFIIALDEIVPSKVPPLEKIRPRVTMDWQRQAALEAARGAAKAFYTTVTNAMAKGKSWEKVCQEQGVSSLDVPLFSLGTRYLPGADPRVPISTLKNLAFGLKPGEVSRDTSISEGGTVLYLKAFVPVEEKKVQTEIKDYTANLRRARQNESFSEWLRRQQLGLQLAIGQRNQSADASSGPSSATN